MTVASIGSNISVYPSLSLPAPAGIPKDSSVAPGADRAGIAQQTAVSYAQNAEFYTSEINKYISIYYSLSIETIEKSVESTRAQYGDEAAAHSQAAMLRLRDTSLSGFQGAAQVLGNEFNVSGPAYNYDAATDTYSAAGFTASVDLGDAAVLFDSTKGPQLSVMGSAFTSNYTRNYLPNVEYLGYSISGNQLFDLKA